MDVFQRFWRGFWQEARQTNGEPEQFKIVTLKFMRYFFFILTIIIFNEIFAVGNQKNHNVNWPPQQI